VGTGSSESGALAQAWNGKTFTFEPTASNGVSFFGVSCTSATACTAVGSATSSAGAGVTLAEAWNGRDWTVEPALHA